MIEFVLAILTGIVVGVVLTASRQMYINSKNAAVMRAAAAVDLAIRPVLTQSSDHYVRIYFSHAGGASTADSSALPG